MTEQKIIADLCHLAGWGPIALAPERITGGLTHRIYRVQTGHGDFAVKVINPTIRTYHGILESLRRGERVARAAALAGLPAVSALLIAGDTVVEIGDSTLLAYPWVEGTAFPSGSAGPEIGARIGGLISSLHALELPWDEPLPSGGSETNEDWESLIAAGEEKDMSWSNEARTVIRELEDWSRLAHAAKRELAGRSVVGHRDLDQKNVLWSREGKPWIVDWESAGPVSPAKEILTAALDWSGHGQDIETFSATLKAYRSHQELLASDARHGLSAYFDWVGWVAHNMRRSLGRNSEDPEERALATREVVNTLRSLGSFAAHLDDLNLACGG